MSLEGQKGDLCTALAASERGHSEGRGEASGRRSAHEQNPHLPPVQPRKMRNPGAQKL